MTLPNVPSQDFDAYGRIVGGRYQVLETLGAGGMAVVYNALDTHLERNVALKMILPSRQSTEMFLERFEVEARSLAQLSHNSIVKVLDYGEDEGVPFLVMEFISGGTLKELTGRPIPYAQAASILAPVARALDYVHQHNIIHQDVKPSNILLTDKDAPMLSDFGVVRLLEEETQESDAATGVGIGTPDYMSPEQGMGRTIDLRADIYSLGVVFYELVTGQKPFTAETPMAVVIQHVTGEFPRPQTAGVRVPPLIEAVIRRAVAKDPTERFENMGCFAAALEEIARGEKLSEAALQRLLKHKPASAQKKRRKVARVTMYSLVTFLALMGLSAAAWSFGLGERMGILPPRSMTPAVAALVTPSQPATPNASTTAAAKNTSPAQASAAPTATHKPTTNDVLSNPPNATHTPTSALSLRTTPRPTKKPNTEADFYRGSVSLIDQPLPSAGEGFGDVDLLGLWGIGAVQQLLYDHSGERVFQATSHGVFVYSTKDLAHLHFIPTRTWVSVIALTPDGKWLYVGLRSGMTLIYDADTYAEQASISYKAPSSERLTKEPAASIQSYGFSSDMTYMALGYANGTLRVFNVTDMSEIYIWDQYKSVSSLYFSDDNRYLYSAKDDSIVNVWDLFSGRVDRTIQMPSPVSWLRISGDGQWLWAGGGGGVLSVIDLSDDRILFNYPSQRNAITAIAVSPDLKTLVMGLQNGEIVYYPYPTVESFLRIQQPVAKFASHPDAVTSLEFSPNGSTLISSSYHEGLLVWDPNTAAQIGSMNKSRPKITRMAFTANDQWLLVELNEKQVEIWDVQESHLLATFDARIPDGQNFLLDKYVILVKDGKNWWDEGSLLVIEHPSAKLIKNLPGYYHGWNVRSSPDDKVLVMGTPQKATIFDISTWERLDIHGGPNSGCGQYFTPENHLITIIWTKGILFENSERVSNLCAYKANFAEVVTLSPRGDRALYKLNRDGRLWQWSLDESSFTNQQNVVTYQPQTGPDEIFLAYSEDNLYLYVKDEDQVLLSTAQVRLQIDDWAAFQYQGAVSSSESNRLVALGSQFGNIVIYGR